MDGANIKARLVLDTGELDKLMGISGGQSNEDVNNPASSKGLLKGVNDTLKGIFNLTREGNDLTKLSSLTSLAKNPMGLALAATGGLASAFFAGAGNVGGNLAEEFGATGSNFGTETLNLDSAEVANQGLNQMADATLNVVDATENNLDLVEERNNVWESNILPLDDKTKESIMDIINSQETVTSNIEKAGRFWEEYNRILQTQVIPSLTRTSPGSGMGARISIGVTSPSDVTDATDLSAIENAANTPSFNQVKTSNITGYNY